MRVLRGYWTDESGMETVEWAVLAALIAVGLLLTVQGIGNNVAAAFGSLKSNTTP